MPLLLAFLFTVLFPTPSASPVSTVAPLTQQTETVLLTGTVLDSETQKPIGYASVGIVNETTGTVSSEAGTFTLRVPKQQLDKTLRLSAIGYETKELSVQDLLSANATPLQLSLKPQPVELAEVQVKGNHWKKKKLGGSAGPNTMFHHNFTAFQRPIQESLGREVGVLIKNGDYPTFLSKLNFCLSQNQFETLKFRVNLYAVKDDKPAARLETKEVLATVQQVKKGWVQIDLEPHNLYVNQDFIIALEWVDGTPLTDSKQLTLAATLPGFHTTFYKDASQASWNKMSAVGVGLNVEVQRAN